MKHIASILAALALALVLVLPVAAQDDGNGSGDGSAAAAATFGAGTVVVGTDIAPGTYRTRTASTGCYWSRLAGFSGSFGDIIANGNTDAPEIVTVGGGDAGFMSTRCAAWTSDLSPITSDPAADFGDGTYQVGVDISPGTWRSQPSSGCYYSRLSSFSRAGIDGIITNANTDAGAIVTIAPTDVGFVSTRCGSWTKIG